MSPGEITKVCGVASQGRPGFTEQGGWFVKTYTLAYSKDGDNWANYKEFGIAKVKLFLFIVFMKEKLR